ATLWPGAPVLRSFIEGSGGPRGRYPFPTRRSSDLRNAGNAASVTRVIPATSATPAATPALASTCPASRRSPFATTAAVAAFRWRSEEHTSELQSRQNLVCRLLLEKKKVAGVHAVAH